MKRALFATLLLAALAADAVADTDYIAKARQGRTVKKFDFTGDDIDATLATVGQKGGSTVLDKMPVGEMGFAAYFRDCEGNLLGLWQNASG